MKYLKYFEAFDIKSIPNEEAEFKELIRKLIPHEFNRYYSLYKNKGLEFAKNRLMSDAEQISVLQAEVKKIKNLEKRQRNAAKKNSFGNSKADFNYYKLSKQKIKEFISVNLLTDELKGIYNKYGFYTLNGNILEPQIDTNNFILSDSNHTEFESKQLTYDHKTTYLFKGNYIDDLKLGYMVMFLNTGSLDKSHDDVYANNPQVFNELNQGNCQYTLGRAFEINFTQKITPIWEKILNNSVSFKLSYSLYKTFRDGLTKYNLIDVYSSNDLNGELIPSGETGSGDLLNKFNKTTNGVFNLLGKKIKSQKIKEADQKYNELKSNILDLCINTLSESGTKYYRYIKLIKENYPQAWELISNKINDKEGLDKATDMAELGFGD